MISCLEISSGIFHLGFLGLWPGVHSALNLRSLNTTLSLRKLILWDHSSGPGHCFLLVRLLIDVMGRAAVYGACYEETDLSAGATC